jgi:DNA-binding IclR family transcriptional regulator
VFDAGGSLVAAVSVSGPANRIATLRGRHYAPAVTAAAREIEASLGVART